MRTPRWTEVERSAMFEAIWGGVTPSCPVDGTAVITLGVEDFVDHYRIHAHCPKCGNSLDMGREDDPRRTALRPWTGAEGEELARSALEGERPRCPVDEARLAIRYGMGEDDRPVVHLRCPRCGEAHTSGIRWA